MGLICSLLFKQKKWNIIKVENWSSYRNKVLNFKPNSSLASKMQTHLLTFFKVNCIYCLTIFQ